MEKGTNHRHLFKVFGIRFDILVDGKVSVQCEGQPDTFLVPVSARWVSMVIDHRKLTRLHSAVLLLITDGPGYPVRAGLSSRYLASSTTSLCPGKKSQGQNPGLLTSSWVPV